jgi:hypothetical protein
MVYPELLESVFCGLYPGPRCRWLAQERSSLFVRRICAWCGKDMGLVGPEGDDPKLITHSICGECAHHQLAQIGMEVPAFLEGLHYPVVVVDSTGIIVTGNTKALEMVKKELSQVEGYPGGEVFECEHARLPGGCGNTVHCSGCTIRKAVMETHSTGKSLLRTPATLVQHSSGDPKEIRLLISTEKVEDVVLLRIDEVNPSGSI